MDEVKSTAKQMLKDAKSKANSLQQASSQSETNPAAPSREKPLKLAKDAGTQSE